MSEGISQSLTILLLINTWNFQLPSDLFFNCSISFGGLAPIVWKKLEQEGKNAGVVEEALHLHAFS